MANDKGMMFSRSRRPLVLKKAPYKAESENDLLQEGFWPVEVKF